MTIAGRTDVGVDLWGGYCCSMPASQLPQGSSPNCQDVIFPEGAVKSRPRLFSFFPALAGNPTINGLKVFSSLLANTLLVLDSLGNLWQEATPGNLTLVQGGFQPGLFMNGTNLFSRFYFGLFDKFGGEDIPRQFDGTNLDRVSQTGPGIAPNPSDEAVTTQTIAASPGGLVPQIRATLASPNGLSQSGNVVTVTLQGGQQLDSSDAVGDLVQISTAGVAGYNGIFPIASIISLTQFTVINSNPGLANSGGASVALGRVLVTMTAAAPTGWGVVGQQLTITGAGVAGYNATPFKVRIAANAGSTVSIFVPQAWTLGNSGGGTIVQSGNISAGLHGVTVAFVTRQGFITCPAIPNFWTAAGSRRVALANIATGPSNIQARLLLFTQVITPPATTGTFFSLPNGVSGTTFAAMLINDNATTSGVFDFSDAALAAGFNGTYLFSQIELGECAAVTDYNSRLVWLRERNKVKADGGGGGFNNLTFDGGFWPFNSGQQPGLPMGWTATANFAGGGIASFSYWAGAYAITGDGATAIRGQITQTAATDYLGNQILQLNTSYSVRVRLRQSGASATQGTFNIELFSASQGSLGIFTVPILNMATQFFEFVGPLMTAQATLPSDLVLRVYAAGTLTNGSTVNADCIELFPTKIPFNLSLARISHANNPESFDGLLDQIQVQALGDLGPAGLQGLEASWKIRSNLYLAKDHYLCYVTDDGQNEPSVWQVQEVSNTIGCCGPNAWDGTEEWVCFSERSGMYYTNGSDPIKVVQEIQEDVSQSGKPNWNATNWLAGYTVWVATDHLNKRILCGLPLNGANSPNLVFHMDYKFSPTGEAMASSQAPTYSTFTGRILVHGNARKWSPWNVTANCAVFSERPDGTAQLFFGNGAGTGKIYQAIDASVQGSDDGTAVNDFYQTYGSPSKFEEEGLQLGHHWKHVGYLTGRAVGSGFLSLTAISPYRTVAIRAVTLSSNPAGDFERKVSINGERVFYQVGTNAVGNWFQLERLIPSVKRHATIPVRGLSA